MASVIADPTAAANGAGFGPSWTNPTNVFSSNDSRSSVALLNAPASQQTSKSLVVTGFDFSVIPSDATIDGIMVEVERNASAGSPSDGLMRLTKDGTLSIGDDKKSASLWPGSDAYASYGNSGDLWGLTWTVAEIKASTFGVHIAASVTGTGANGTANIDHVRMTVWYTTAGGVRMLAISGVGV